MFKFIIKKLLHRFIIVYLQENTAFIHIYDIEDGKILNSDIETFEIEKKDELTDEVIEFINKKQSQINRSYIVTLVNSLGQGIIPTCDDSKFADYNIDKKYIYYICIDNKFTNYVTKADIKWIQKTFEKCGIDLIFSPFIILKKLIELENRDNREITLYILYQNLYVTLMICKDDKYIYGSFFDTLEDKNPLYLDFEEESDSNEEDIFEIDELIDNDFDVDLIENIDEKVDETEILENNYKQEIELIQQNKGFTNMLSKALKEYYTNKIYDSNFVDKVIIFSENDVDINIIKYIENDLFLSVDIKKVDIDKIILELCKEELF